MGEIGGDIGEIGGDCELASRNPTANALQRERSAEFRRMESSPKTSLVLSTCADTRVRCEIPQERVLAEYTGAPHLGASVHRHPLVGCMHTDVHRTFEPPYTAIPLCTM